MYADDLVLMSKTIEGLGNKFLKWKEAYYSKCLKVNLGKTKVIVSGGITKDSMSKSKVDPCWVSSLKIKVNSVLVYNVVNESTVYETKWTPKFSRHFTYRKCEEDIVEQ